MVSGEVDRYLAELARRLGARLGADLVGVYAGGSYALGAYEPGRSDVDVAAVVGRPLAAAEKEAVVAAVRHEALTCPARGLELVVYRLDATRVATTEPAFELNLNTGPRMTFRFDHEPDPAETHWFAIDRSILAERGVAITGPPASEVFAPIPRAAMLPVVLRSLRWHADGEAPPDDAVLNACRSLRFALEGVWTSKREAGEWAAEHVDDPGLVADALRARGGEPVVDRERARAFAERVAARVEVLATRAEGRR